MTTERLGGLPHSSGTVLTHVVDEFTEAWAHATASANSEPPELATFLPDAASIRRSVLFELVQIDLRNRWLGNGAAKRLIDYCTEFPELRPEDLPASLIFDEFVVRRQAGQSVDARLYLVEFPAQAAELRAVLNTDDDPSTQFVIGDNTATDSEQTAYAEPTMYTEPTVYSEQTAYSEPTFADPTAAVSEPTVGEATVTDDVGATVARRVDATDPGTKALRSTNPLDDIEIGQRIDDFDLLTPLGSGAFARVFLARQRSIQRLVAVKVSADHGTEPQTLAQLDHDYIVRIFDQRRLSRRGLKLLYMQYLPGGTLLGVLRWVRDTAPEQRSGQLLLDAVDAAMAEKGESRPTDSSVRAEIQQLSWPETVAWLGQRLAEALDYAGSRGVLHRDIKPANVLVSSDGVPKLADFNISFSRNVAGASAVAYFGGSLSYMSPEQLEACHPNRARGAADLDTRSDIYSLGVVLWELLTGRKPFGSEISSGATNPGDTTLLDEMIERRRRGVSAETLTEVPADCPATLSRVLTTCLQSDRENRWANGAELAQQLELCLDARARELVDPTPNSWRLRARRWKVPILVLALLVPNVLASIYNVHHNQTLVISRLPDAAQLKFGIITQVVNGTFFPLGAVLTFYLSRYLFLVPRGLRAGRTFSSADIARARAHALRFGDRAALVVFTAWVIAGVTFPIALRLVSGSLPTDAYFHFLTSLVACGAIAVTYPFFVVNFYIVRCVYPEFLRFGETGADDIRQLEALDRRANRFLAIAAAVPLLAVTSATFVGPADIPQIVVAVRVLSVGAIVAFAIAYVLFRRLEADIRALVRVVAPRDEGAPTTETSP